MITYDDSKMAVRPLPARPHASALRRAEHLTHEDRILVELTLSKTATCRQLAALLGISSGTALRRAWRIADRLYDPLVVRLIERPANLRPEYRQLGLEYFLHGKTIQQLQDVHQISKSKIRAILDYLRIWSKT